MICVDRYIYIYMYVYYDFIKYIWRYSMNEKCDVGMYPCVRCEYLINDRCPYYDKDNVEKVKEKKWWEE